MAANDYHLEDDGWEPDCEREERAFIERSAGQEGGRERPSVDGQGSEGGGEGQGEVEGAHHKSLLSAHHFWRRAYRFLPTFDLCT